MNIYQLSDEDLLLLCRESVEAQEVLIGRYTRLVRACARRFFLLGGDNEDLVQEGMIGLLNAIRQYQTDVGNFPTYAAKCINSRLISAVRAASAKKHTPLNESVSILNYSDEYLASADLTDNPEDQLIDREQYSEYLAKLYMLLSTLEKRILDAYLEGMSCSEIAESIHRPVKSVGNAVQRIKAKAAGILSRR